MMFPSFPQISSWRSTSPTWQPERFRAMIYSHPQRQQVNWWKAVPSTDWDETRGRRVSSDATLDSSIYNYIAQSVAQYRALVEQVDITKRWAQQAQLLASDLILTAMPDEIPVGVNDKVQPLGNASGEARTYRYSEVVTRGANLVLQSGTISSSSTAITGVGTTFTTQVQAGDVINALNQSVRVVSVTDNTHLTVDTAPSPAWSGLSWSKGLDRLRQETVASFDTVLDANAVNYTSGFSVGSDGHSVQWTTATGSPAPGVRYSVVYRFYPVYFVPDDLVLPGPMAYGKGLPERVILRLHQPETFQS